MGGLSLRWLGILLLYTQSGCQANIYTLFTNPFLSALEPQRVKWLMLERLPASTLLPYIDDPGHQQPGSGQANSLYYAVCLVGLALMLLSLCCIYSTYMYE